MTSRRPRRRRRTRRRLAVSIPPAAPWPLVFGLLGLFFVYVWAGTIAAAVRGPVGLVLERSLGVTVAESVEVGPQPPPEFLSVRKIEERAGDAAKPVVSVLTAAGAALAALATVVKAITKLRGED